MGGFSFRPFPLWVANVLCLWNWSFHHPAPPHSPPQPPLPSPLPLCIPCPCLLSVLPNQRQKHVAHIKDLQLKQTNKKILSTLVLESQSRSVHQDDQSYTKVKKQMGGGEWVLSRSSGHVLKWLLVQVVNH